MSVERIGETLVPPILATHPNIRKEPAYVKMFLACQNFKRKKFWRGFHLEGHNWHDLELEVPASGEDRIRLLIEIDRTWQPLKVLGILDSQRLGVGIGEIWLKYPDKILGETPLDPEDSFPELEGHIQR